MRRSISLQDFEGAGTDDGASVDSAEYATPPRAAPVQYCGILTADSCVVRSVSMRRVRSLQNLEGGREGGSPTPSGGHAGARLPVLSERELREHFNRPLNEVAKKYGMCTTALKKLCRRKAQLHPPPGHRSLSLPPP